MQEHNNKELETPLSLAELLSLHDQSMTYFTPKFENGANNERRYLGDNWTPEQKAEIKNQGRQPYSIPIIQTKLNIVSATQKESRTSYKVDAVSDPQDEVKAELATLQIKEVEKRSKFKYLESDIFDLGLSISHGVTKMDLDYSNGYPSVVVKPVDYRNFVWDSNSIAYDIDKDALFVCELEKLYRYQLDEKYDTSGISTSDQDGRGKVSYYCSPNTNGQTEYDVVSVFNHFHKVLRDYYCVIFPDTQGIAGKSGLIGKYRTKAEAESMLKELNYDYLSNGFEEEGSIETKTETRLDYYKFVYNKILDYKELELEAFPYNVYFAFRMGNDFVPFMDLLKDAQLFIDRVVAQIDYSIGKGLKNVLGVNISAVDQNLMTPAKVMATAAKGGIIPIIGNGAKVFENYNSDSINPQYFQILNIMQSYLEDLAGGRSFQGLSEGSNEPGIAIEKKQKMGMKIALNFIDNLRRWKQAVGENILRWVKEYETYEKVLRIQIGELSEEMLATLEKEGAFTQSMKKDGSGYLKINSGSEITYLKDADLELVVTETELTDTERQIRYLKMIQAEQTNAALVQLPTWNRLKLEYMDIPLSDRSKLIKEFEEAQAAAAQQAQAVQQQQMNMQKAQILSGMNNKISNN